MAKISKPWHLVIWIDHEIAHLYAETRSGVEEIATILAGGQETGHTDYHSGNMVPGHPAPDEQFLAEVTAAAHGACQILIVGPSDCRMALRHHMETHAPVTVARIVGVEPMRRSSERQIHAFARHYFYRQELMSRSGA
jgi:hypothetical protein